MFLLTVKLFYQKVDNETKLHINKNIFEIIKKDRDNKNKDKTKPPKN